MNLPIPDSAPGEDVPLLEVASAILVREANERDEDIVARWERQEHADGTHSYFLAAEEGGAARVEFTLEDLTSPHRLRFKVLHLLSKVFRMVPSGTSGTPPR